MTKEERYDALAKAALDENALLKAEVERLKTALAIAKEQRDSSIGYADWDDRDRLKQENQKLREALVETHAALVIVHDDARVLLGRCSQTHCVVAR